MDCQTELRSELNNGEPLAIHLQQLIQCLISLRILPEQAKMRCSQPIGTTTRSQCIPLYATTGVTSQDGGHSAHWYHNQVTVHPVVCYYGCDKPRWGAFSTLVSQPGDSASRRVLLRVRQAKMRGIQHIGITTR